MEVCHPSVDNVVATGQSSAVNGDVRYQQAVTDPPAPAMVNGVDTGRQAVRHQSSSSRHGEQRQGRGHQQRRHKGHRGGSSPDSSPDDSGADRSRRPSRHGGDSRDSRQRSNEDKQPSKDRSPDRAGPVSYTHLTLPTNREV